MEFSDETLESVRLSVCYIFLTFFKDIVGHVQKDSIHGNIGQNLFYLYSN